MTCSCAVCAGGLKGYALTLFTEDIKSIRLNVCGNVAVFDRTAGNIASYETAESLGGKVDARPDDIVNGIAGSRIVVDGDLAIGLSL